MTLPKVYLYNFSCDDHSLTDLEYLLGEQRFEYCAKMKSVKAGLCSAYAFLLLRYALKQEFGITDIPRFTYNEHGKPFLCGAEGIYFNMSHAAERVVCAVSRSPVGADIQDIRKMNLRTAEKFLTAGEFSAVSGITDENKLNAELCRLWCIKESYGKFTGKGFGEGFTDFEADPLVTAGKVRWVRKDNYFISVCGGS